MSTAKNTISHYESIYRNLLEKCTCKSLTYLEAKHIFNQLPVGYLYPDASNEINVAISKILKVLHNYCVKEDIIASDISYEEFCKGKGLCNKLYPLPIKELKKIYEENDYSNTTNETYHEDLVSSCSFSEFYYSLSFRRRIEFKLGVVHYYIDFYPPELKVLSNEELEGRLNSIEKPWWDDLFEEIEDDKRLLHILYDRGCSLDDLKTLYNAVRSNDTETIDSMEKRAKTIMFKGIILFRRVLYTRKEIVSVWKESSTENKIKTLFYLLIAVSVFFLVLHLL